MAQKCKRCSCEFAHLFLLKQHLKRKGSCADFLSCGLTSEELLNALSKKDAPSFKCSICEKVYKSKAGLNIHKKDCEIRQLKQELENMRIKTQSVFGNPLYGEE